MSDHECQRSPFLEWGRENSVVEDKRAGQTISSSRKFVAGTWTGQFILTAMLLLVLAVVLLIPSVGKLAFFSLISRLI